MQMMENESHITFSICENGEIIRKSYFMETGIDGAYKLKCTKHRAKNGPNPTNTVLHLRVHVCLCLKDIFRFEIEMVI